MPKPAKPAKPVIFADDDGKPITGDNVTEFVMRLERQGYDVRSVTDRGAHFAAGQFLVFAMPGK